MSTTAPRNMHNPYTEAEITEALMAVIVWAGNATAAAKALAEKGVTVHADTLRGWIHGVHAEKYAALRDKYADQLETQLVHDYRDGAALAARVAHTALEKAQERLEDNKDQDPAKTAANAAAAVDKLTRNALTLSGRPTSIKETRGLTEVLRSLAAKGILQLPEGETPPDATVVDDTRADE